MIGAYYEWEPNQAIGALGQTEAPGLSFAENTLRDILSGSLAFPGMKPVQPLGLYTPWGSRTGSVDWTDVTPEWDLLLYPLTQAQLAMVKKAAFGHEVGWVAVLTTTPLKQTASEAIFRGTPYVLFSTDGVYRQDDRLPVPRIYFLYWGQLRGEPTDLDGGAANLEAAAARAGGQLVFPLHVPRGAQDRDHPAMAFQTALDTQLGAGLPPTAPPPTRLAKQPPEVGPGPGVPRPIPWGLLLGLGAAAGVGWWLWKRSGEAS